MLTEEECLCCSDWDLRPGDTRLDVSRMSHYDGGFICSDQPDCGRDFFVCPQNKLEDPAKAGPNGLLPIDQSLCMWTLYLPSLQFLSSVLHKQRPLIDTPTHVFTPSTQSIEKKRDTVVCCLITFLGERQEGLFHDCQECEECTDETMKVIVMHNVMAGEDPSDVLIEGKQVIEECGSRTKACILLMGLIYALNLEYPKQLKNTFEAFQKLFLELDGAKLLKKVHSLKNKLMQ